MARVVLDTLLVALVCHAVIITAKRRDFMDYDMMEMIKDDKNECMKEHGTTEDMIDKASDGIIPNDRRITCYMSCLLTRLGMLDENGSIDKDMMMSAVPDHVQDIADKVFDKCGKSSGADTCEKMYNGALCVYQSSPDLWFMV